MIKVHNYAGGFSIGTGDEEPCCERCGRKRILYNYLGSELCSECVLESLDMVEGTEDRDE